MKNKYFRQILLDFMQWLERLNYAKGSVRSRTRQLKKFLCWLEEKGINRLEEVSGNELKLYNEMLHQQPYNYRTIQGYVSVFKLLNEYLESYGEAPMIKVKLAVVKGIRTERRVLSVEEISKLYETCEGTFMGKRDRIILAVYYGCGLRSREGIRLEVNDVDFNNGLLHVRMGKNYRERYVPLSDGVRRELYDWIEGGLRYFSGGKTSVLLPTQNGGRLQNSSLNKRLKVLCKKANVEEVSLHNLRHSIATHLLTSGMELEKISQFLGHKGLEATQIYTRILNQEDG